MAILAFLGAAAPSLIIALVAGGLIGVVVWVLTSRRGTSRKWSLGLIVGAVVALVIFGAFAFSQAYTPVQYGTVAVVVRFGGLTGQVFEPGLHWRTPFIDEVKIIPTVVLSYETSDEPTQSNANYTDIPVTAQTVDGQQITIKYTVLFRVPPDKAVTIVQNVGFTDRVVENVIKAYSRNQSRLLAQNYTAANLYGGQGIFDYENKVREALTVNYAEFGLVLDDFLVRKVEFSQDYITAVEQKQIAQEGIETAKYKSEAAEYEKEQQIRLAEADAQRIKLTAAADAERIKVTAQADAEKQRLLADAEAYSIKARGEALKQYPGLIQWQFVSNLQNVQWGILPSEGITPLVPIPSFEGTTP